MLTSFSTLNSKNCVSVEEILQRLPGHYPGLPESNQGRFTFEIWLRELIGQTQNSENGSRLVFGFLDYDYLQLVSISKFISIKLMIVGIIYNVCDSFVIQFNVNSLSISRMTLRDEQPDTPTSSAF